jgi:hypothetical protein
MPEQTEQLSRQNQATFAGGLNAQYAPHLIGENEVALATNIDFSLEWGGLICRRGSVLMGLSAGGNANFVSRNYNGSQGSLDSSPWYVITTGTTSGTLTIGGAFYRGSNSGSALTLTSIAAADPAANNFAPSVGAPYQNYMYMANGSVAIRDNGTNAYTWLLDQPPQIYTQINLASSAQTGLFSINQGVGGFNGTWTSGVGGQGSGGHLVLAGSSTVGAPILSTFTNGLNGTATDSGIVAVAAVTGTGTYVLKAAVSTQTIPNTNFNQPWYLLAQNTNVSGGYDGTALVTTTAVNGVSISPNSAILSSIGTYGVEHIQIGFSNPNAVQSISIDYSIWDTNFFNYWHAQTTINQLQASPIDSPGVISFPISNPASLVQALPNGILTWAIPRPNFQLLGTLAQASGLSGWDSIAAIRVSIQTTDQTTMIVGTPTTYGNLFSNLVDTVNGFSWFQTYARVENGVVVAEGAPSVPSEPTGTATDSKPVLFQYGNAFMSVGFYAGSSTSGATHRIIYRQGGNLNDAYQVDIIPLSNGNTFLNACYPDSSLVFNSTMTRSLWSSWPARGVSAISEPFQERIFVGTGNSLFWSTPGNPAQIEADSDVTVSVQGDPIQAFSVWDRLIIINNNSVYEMDGSIFEGHNQDWTLRRTGAKRGSAAHRTCVKTPWGIFLFSSDGCSLYYPGYGIDTPMDWVYDKIGDLWRGNSANSPALQKGRIPPLNLSAVGVSCATYFDNKIYLAVPTGGSIAPNTLFVLDMIKHEVWMYTYAGFTIQSLFWDYAAGRLCAGTGNGVVQLETGQLDAGGTPIAWNVQTRAWTTPNDIALENLMLEAVNGGGLNSIKAIAVLDNTNTQTLGTITSTNKQWYTTPMLGTIANNVAFRFSGTCSQTGSQQGVYQLQWETLIQPPRTAYFLTPHFSVHDMTGVGRDLEGWWHECDFEMDCLGGTVTGTAMIDNVAVMTFTVSGSNKQGYSFSFPTETYGNEAQVVFNAVTGFGLPGVFKHWHTWYNVTPEPSRSTFFESELHAIPSESYIKTWLPDINPLGGVVSGTLYTDGILVAIQTMTGSVRRKWEWSPSGVANVVVGKTLHSEFQSGTPFKYWPSGMGEWEIEQKPFNKTNWIVTYKKLGGVTQLDMARYFAVDVEGPLNALITNTWILDGQVYQLNTFALSSTNAGEASSGAENFAINTASVIARMYADQIPFLPGARGYLFQQQMSSSQPFKVWRSNIDIDRVGVKGLSRVTLNGTPSQT